MMTKNNHTINRRHAPLNGQGFTIIELLIATTVLSVILVLVSAMMISIGRLYFKGTNQAKIQSNARAITDEVAQRLQFNTQEPEGPFAGATASVPGFTTTTYCIGKVRYTYNLDNQIAASSDTANHKIRHVLWRDTLTAGCTAGADLSNANPSAAIGSGGVDGTELIASKSQLTAFSIIRNAVTNTSPYEVTVGVAYGDFDLFSGSGLDKRCSGEAAGQFCATAYLKTTVGKRL